MKEMFEQAFKNIDDVLHRDAGSATELDYIEQTSWILFLKYLDDLEQTKKTEAALAGKRHSFIIDPQYRWGAWAEPKTTDGKPDYKKALSGDDLRDFVNNKLFPYLKKFRTEADGPDTIEYKIGEIFSELKNKIQSGYRLREILDIVDKMHFRTDYEKHELSHLYEEKIKKMGNAGRNGGEYYTPRPLIRTIVKIVAPKVGDKIYDGACGSAGFLIESFDYLKRSKDLSTTESMRLQNATFYGKEIKSLAYIIGVMNMIALETVNKVLDVYRYTTGAEYIERLSSLNITNAYSLKHNVGFYPIGIIGGIGSATMNRPEVEIVKMDKMLEDGERPPLFELLRLSAKASLNKKSLTLAVVTSFQALEVFLENYIFLKYHEKGLADSAIEKLLDQKWRTKERLTELMLSLTGQSANRQSFWDAWCIAYDRTRNETIHAGKDPSIKETEDAMRLNDKVIDWINAIQ